MFENLEMTD